MNEKFDLEQRTGEFGKDVVTFCKSIPNNSVNNPLISQLVRAGTSVGANYCEADDAESKADFIHKLSICKKEAREVRHWLKMISIAEESLAEKAEKIADEARQLNLIFNAIIKKTKQNLEIKN